MKVTFLFSDNFPGNSAYSNRIHSLAKGLIYTGNKVEVAVVYPGQKQSSTNHSMKGIHDNVIYNYYCGIKYKPLNQFVQKMIGLYGTINFFLFTLFNRKNRPDVIISCSSLKLHLFFLFLLKKIFGLIVLREYNEFPKFVLNKKKRLLSVKKYKMLDGFIFMTVRLERFFKEELNINKPSTIVNMTVDEDRFELDINTHRRNCITLVGDILGEKDGVGILLTAFKKIHVHFPDIKLKLVGTIKNTKLYEQRIQLVDTFKLTEHVEFTGITSREDIPRILTESKLLLLPRPHSLQSESGFPTKLGEYLMSGTPVVLTDTGEVSKFLSDSKDAFLCEAGNADIFAEKVIAALTNYEQTKIVGLEGRKTALEHFSYKKQGEKLSAFLISMFN